MRYLVDIVHPAHVHFYKHLVRALQADDHEVHIVARKKEVTTALLDGEDLPYITVGEAGEKGFLRQGLELLSRDLTLVREIHSFHPHVLLTRNPAGAQAGRITRTPTVFDSDDGRAVGLHFRAAVPFAHAITTPDCLREDYGAKHVKYPSYKALAYLHPHRYKPDSSVLDLLGVAREQRYFLVRFVAMSASHDRHEEGISTRSKRAVTDLLQERGRVFITSEGPLPPDLEPLRFKIPPHRLHDALAFSSLCVGDSGTLPAEAAMLGVPSIRFSTFAGKLSYLNELEDRYRLTYGFQPYEFDEFFATLDELSLKDRRQEWSNRRERMLEDKCDLTTWYSRFLEMVGDGRELRRGRVPPVASS